VTSLKTAKALLLARAAEQRYELAPLMSRPEMRGRLTPRFRTIQVCPKD
jgi:hypothetical protein